MYTRFLKFLKFKICIFFLILQYTINNTQKSFKNASYCLKYECCFFNLLSKTFVFKVLLIHNL